MAEKVFLVGGGAHAFSILDMLHQERAGYDIAGYMDEKETTLSLNYFGTDKEFLQSKRYDQSNTLLVMCIGIDIELRAKLFRFFKTEGYRFLSSGRYTGNHSIIDRDVL